MLITIAVCAVIGIIVFAILCPTLYAIYNRHIKRQNKNRSKAYQIKGNEDMYGALCFTSLVIAIVVAAIVGLCGYNQVVTKETYHTVYTNTVNADVEVTIKAAKITLKGGQVSDKTRDDITEIIGKYPVIKHKTDENNNTVEPAGTLTLKKNKATVEKEIDVVIVKGPETANKVSHIEYGKAAITEKLFGRYTVGHKTKTIARVTMDADYPDDAKALNDLLDGK